jgi:uncharacterized protein (TIGR02284 family)
MNDTAKIISTLNDLIAVCKDGEQGFAACASQASSVELKAVLQNRIAECRRAADQLQAHVQDLGGKPDVAGSVLGTVHRGWVAVRTTVSPSGDLAVLAECERGEESALESYRDALTQDLPLPIHNLVETQMQGVQRNHDMIKRLRDSTQGKPRTS